MRIVLLTRTGRPSGEKILKRLLMAKKEVVGVIGERRSSLLMKKGGFAFLRDAFKHHGIQFLWERALEVLMSSRKGRKDPLGNLCDEHDIPFCAVEDHNSLSTASFINSLEPDVLITANTRIIKDHILKIPKKAAVNFHTSKLPQYAGLDSIFWALYHGEREIGVTVHYLAEGVDTGDIILQKAIPVSAGDNVSSLTQKANDVGSQLMVEAMERLERGDVRAVPQDFSRRTYFSWPTPSQRRELRKRIKKPACS